MPKLKEPIPGEVDQEDTDFTPNLNPKTGLIPEDENEDLTAFLGQGPNAKASNKDGSGMDDEEVLEPVRFEEKPIQQGKYRKYGEKTWKTIWNFIVQTRGVKKKTSGAYPGKKLYFEYLMERFPDLNIDLTRSQLRDAIMQTREWEKKYYKKNADDATPQDLIRYFLKRTGTIFDIPAEQ